MIRWGKKVQFTRVSASQNAKTSAFVRLRARKRARESQRVREKVSKEGQERGRGEVVMHEQYKEDIYMNRKESYEINVNECGL